MKKLINITTISLLTLFIFAVAILTAPKMTKWRYQIRGYVQIEGESRPAIWYTDSIDHISDDSITYHNSDGSRVVIDSPYILYDNSK
jgi:hypothetical protein